MFAKPSSKDLPSKRQKRKRVALPRVSADQSSSVDLVEKNKETDDAIMSGILARLNIQPSASSPTVPEPETIVSTSNIDDSDAMLCSRCSYYARCDRHPAIADPIQAFIDDPPDESFPDHSLLQSVRDALKSDLVTAAKLNLYVNYNARFLSLRPQRGKKLLK